jgi:hypothetical protein
MGSNTLEYMLLMSILAADNNTQHHILTYTYANTSQAGRS